MEDRTRGPSQSLQFMGEPKGEFMTGVPIGYAAVSSKGPQKKPLEIKTRYLE